MAGFRSDINGLRAIAVSSVLLFHAGVPLIGGGFAGVDVFFVISGFLMTQIIMSGLDAGRFSLLRFWAARIRRILPALLALCAALALGGWFLVDPMAYREIGLQVAAALTFLSNIQFWREAGYFDEAAGSKWLLHTWSLAVEWQFYMAYPLVLLAAHRWLGRRAVAPLLWMGFVLSLILSGVVTAWRPAVAFYMLPTRAWELLAGGLVFLHARHLARLTPRARLGLEGAGLALIVLSVLVVSFRTPWPSCWALLPVCGAAAVIAADRGRASMLNRGPVQLLGLWSYSIYLWHWPVIVALRYGGWLERWWAVPVAILLGIGAGALSYMTIESACRARPESRRKRWDLAVLAAGAAAVLVWSGLDMRHDGFLARARNPELVAASLAARADWSFPDSTCARTGTDHSTHFCRIGSGSDTGTLVIGDSHANQWYPRADHPGADVVFVTRDGCPPLPDLRITPGPDCPDFYRTALKAATDGRYRTIVVAAFWTAYLGPKAGASGVCLIMGRDCVPPGLHPEAVAQVLSDLIRDFGPIAARSQVIFVLPDLEPPGDLPALLAEDAFFGAHRPELEERPASAVRAETAALRDALRQAAAAIGARTVDPLDELCGGETCPLEDDAGRPLFRDSNHLRASVVRTRLDLLDPYFGLPGPD